MDVNDNSLQQGRLDAEPVIDINYNSPQFHNSVTQTPGTDTRVLLDSRMNETTSTVSFVTRENSRLFILPVEESAKAVSLVSAITGSYRELGNNWKTRVKITEGNLAGQFRLETFNSGDNGKVIREEVAAFRFIRPAASRLWAEMVVAIIVEDINHHSPEFMTVPTCLELELLRRCNQEIINIQLVNHFVLAL